MTVPLRVVVGAERNGNNTVELYFKIRTLEKSET